MRPITAEEIESLAIGAWILGTGGGGSPYLALLNMRQLYRQGVVCQLMDASELADDDLVAVVSNMGAPLVGQERLTDPQDDGAGRHDDGGVPRPEVPRPDVARDRRRQLHPALHGAPPCWTCRWSTATAWAARSPRPR